MAPKAARNGILLLLLLLLLATACSGGGFTGSGGKSETGSGGKKAVTATDESGTGSGTGSATGSGTGSAADSPKGVTVPVGGTKDGKSLLPSGAKITGGESKDKSIATFDPATGTITAVAPGTTVIKVQTDGGEQEIKVTVTADDAVNTVGGGSNDGNGTTGAETDVGSSAAASDPDLADITIEDGELVVNRDPCDKEAGGGLLGFETYPDGSTPTEGDKIADQYLKSHGLRFWLEQGDAKVGPATMAKAGPPLTAFQCSPEHNGGCAPEDALHPGTQIWGVKQFFMTDDGEGNNSAYTIVVGYGSPVKAASGVLLDVDGVEHWTIEGLDKDGKVIATTDIRSTSKYSHDGDGVKWELHLDGDPAIRKIRFVPDAANTSNGFAMDNFSPAGVCTTIGE